MEHECPLPYSEVSVTCPYPEPDVSSPCPRPISWIHIFIVSFHLRLCLQFLPSGVFPSRRPTTCPPPIPATCLAYLILPDL